MAVLDNGGTDIQMSKRKHPEDRAARMKINEEKKARKGGTLRIARVPSTASDSVSSDE